MVVNSVPDLLHHRPCFRSSMLSEAGFGKLIDITLVILRGSAVTDIVVAKNVPDNQLAFLWPIAVLGVRKYLCPL